MWSAAVRFSPVPPAFSEISITGGPSGSWNVRTHPARSRVDPSRRRNDAPALFDVQRDNLVGREPEVEARRYGQSGKKQDLSRIKVYQGTYHIGRHAQQDPAH